MRIDVDSRSHGPLFDGRARAAVDAFCDEAEAEIGQHGANVIRTELGAVLKHPTGYYQSQIQTDRASGDSTVWDGGVIYGPWLEGVGSRNKTTRFKGYATFRRMTAKIQAEAAKVAEEVLPRFLGRMG
jgi:hypothetical protein